MSYEWRPGDGSGIISTDAETNHSYSSLGQYNAELTVINKDGISDTDNVLINVSTTAPASPSSLQFE